MSIDSLREVGLLADVGEERVADLEASGEERRFAVGEFLFHEGDPATCFMFLLDGELETTKSMGGDDVVLQRHVPGGYLGAIALLTDTPFRASTRAVKPSRVFCLEPDAFHRLVLEEPTVRRVIYRVFDPVMQGLQGAAAQREKARGPRRARGRARARAEQSRERGPSRGDGARAGAPGP